MSKNYILLLEDKPGKLKDLQDCLESFLDAYDIQSLSAKNFAPQRLREFKTLNLVVLDCEIARYEEYLLFLRNQSSAVQTPVLLHLDEENFTQIAGEALQKGITDFIVYPLQDIKVMARVQANLALFISRQEVALKKEALEELSRTQNHLMSIVAHDLKSPLNRVQGLIQLVPMVGSLNEEQKLQVDMVSKVIQSGQKLIEDILTINAYEADYEGNELSQFDLNELLPEILESHRQVAKEKNIEIHFSSQKTPFHFISDEESLRRIMDNLISNAIKFSEPDKNVFLRLAEKKGQALIEVEDQGPGISEQDQKRMFKKFQKLSARPTGGETSTGLGLSIIKVLTKKLGGKIEYFTELGQGTTFMLYLPSKPKK